jgi:hypothetical protein
VKLLRYIGEKHFNGEDDQLKEYNIAVQLFGRPADYFNPSDDAIARVEAHRLRKRLKEYYETEGKDHTIHISIPPGSYVPVFSRQALADEGLVHLASAAEPDPAPPPPEPPAAVPPFAAPESRPYLRLVWLLIVAAAALILAVAIFRPNRTHKPQLAATSSGAANVNPGAPAIAAAEVPLRIMAGYSGPQHLDSSGNVWQPDRYFAGGRSLPRIETLTERTNRPFLFQQWRNGEFTYEIPLKPGGYELHLYFVDPRSLEEIASSSGTETFSLHINGTPVLVGFDVESDALGGNTADERVFKDVHPAIDGKLHLGFQGETVLPYLNAIEILPGTPHRQLPIRIATQPTSFTDHTGKIWRPDDYYLDGRVSAAPHPVSGTPDPNLFANERFGHFTYAIPVDLAGQYTLILHFAEFYFGPQAPGGGGVGNRVFNVMCNGVMLLNHFDIYKEAGSFHSVTKTFYHLKPTAQGKLNLTFEPVANNATISGIEVIDESN